MSEHFHRELDRLREKFLAQGERVEQTIEKALQSLFRRDEELAREVINQDYQIDEREIEIEEDCLKLLALHQPIAGDLRFLISAIKINNDLERIADLSTNICERVINISELERIDVHDRFRNMTDRVEQMVRKSLKSLVETDAEMAREVRREDDEVDRMHVEMFDLLAEEIKSDPSVTDNAIQHLSASRYLERIADHATNIAEDVIYMMEGEIVRHTSTDENHGED